MALWTSHVEPAFVERLSALVRTCLLPFADELDRRDVYPSEPIRLLAEAGFTSLLLPREYGGEARPNGFGVSVFEEVAYASGAAATSLITIFQVQNALHRYGCERLKALYLPRFRQGLISSFALSEVGHGSDIRHVSTRARRDGDGWTLEGQKSYVSSGGEAALFAILAETERGVSLFVLPRDTPNVRCVASAQSASFGLRNGPHVDLELEGARLPLDHLLGEEGKGVRQAATVLDYSRPLAAGISLGIARAAFDGALAFARERMAFDKHVIEFQGIQWYFAELLADIDAARLLTYDAARALDEGREIARTSAEAKLFASKVASHAAAQAVQICGAHGVTEGAPFGRYLRDAKAYEIAGGSSEILKNTIGRYLQRLGET